MNGDLSQGGDGIISGALVSGNIIFDNGTGGGSGINMDGVQNSRIENNLIYDNHSSGISLYRIDGGGGSNGNVVVNNTIHIANNGRWALNIKDGSTGNTAFNNILVSQHPTYGAIDIDAESRTGFVSDYNVVKDRFSNDDSFISLAAWRSQTGQDLHSIIAQPGNLFENWTTGDYELLATAVARDAGIASLVGKLAPQFDITGGSRPVGAKIDIGAYEFGADAARRRFQSRWDGRRRRLHGLARHGGTQEQYQLWKTHFGESNGSASLGGNSGSRSRAGHLRAPCRVGHLSGLSPQTVAAARLWLAPAASIAIIRAVASKPAIPDSQAPSHPTNSCHAPLARPLFSRRAVHDPAAGDHGRHRDLGCRLSQRLARPEHGRRLVDAARRRSRFVHSEAFAYVIGWAIVLTAVFGLGVLIESGARRWIQGLLDSVLGRLPMLGGIYGTVRQLVGMMDSKGSPDLKGMSVVYCIFGSENGAAFLALLATPESFRIGELDYNAVIIPSAPVPVGGSLLFVPAASVRPAGITVDAFMSVYVSMGVTGPQFLQRFRLKVAKNFESRER